MTASLPPAARKAALRARPDWLDALDLPCDAAPTTRLDGPLPPNAAERWSATLPSASDLAIAAERARRDARDERPSAAPVACEAPLACGPLPPFVSAWQEARRNALCTALAIATLIGAWHWLA